MGGRRSPKEAVCLLDSEPPWETRADESNGDTQPVQSCDLHHTPNCSELGTFLNPGS